MSITSPIAREQRIRAIDHSARSLWMSEPSVPPHQRHELLVRLTALELHIEHLDLATSANPASMHDIDSGIEECEAEFIELSNHWATDAGFPMGIPA